MKFVVFAVILVILVMIVIMFTVLKKIVRIVNEQSKNYFFTKLQSYDTVILEKENKLKEINDQIKLACNNNNKIESDNIKNEKIDYYYNDEVPEYQSENILEQFRKIDKSFNFDNKKIIKEFVENIDDNDTRLFEVLSSIKNKLTFDLIYELQINSFDYQLDSLNNLFSEEEKEVLSDYINSNNNFDILEFQNYINCQILLNDPIIYVNVSNAMDNYDYIDKRIKTVYDKKIVKGMAIIYKNKIYDFSLR